MREIILREYPTLGDLIGSINTAREVTCDLCGKIHKHTHDPDCSYYKNKEGDCNCDHLNEILNIAGLNIVNKCCGAKLMEIIACLMGSIARNIAPLLKKYSATISNVAARLAPQEQWCVFRQRGGPTMLGILFGVVSSRGFPELLIMGVDNKLYQYSPIGDIFFILYEDKETALNEFQKLINPGK